MVVGCADVALYVGPTYLKKLLEHVNQKNIYRFPIPMPIRAGILRFSGEDMAIEEVKVAIIWDFIDFCDSAHGKQSINLLESLI